MTSTRLPGKVLADLCGKPMLSRQLERLRLCRQVDAIVIATTVNDTDDPLVELAEREGIVTFRGSENDVLSRYLGAARAVDAELIVRITSDCPLIDAAIVDRVIETLANGHERYDYAANILKRTYPRGMDVESFFVEALERSDRMAFSPQDREHVTSFIRQDKTGLFRCCSITDREDNSDLRWTVDTATDLELVREIYRRLQLDRRHADYAEILKLVRSHPELARANQTVKTWDPIDHSGRDTNH